jgi:hypothetical protein
MAQEVIPEPWRKDVCAILATEATGTLIEWKIDAERRYQATPDALWNYEVYKPFIDFLSSPAPTGCHVTMDTPPGETYEFYFTFKGQRLYGKILLRTDRKRIVIFSAHTPLKPKLSCE